MQSYAKIIRGSNSKGDATKGQAQRILQAMGKRK